MSGISVFQTQLANHFGISVDTSSAWTSLRFPFWGLVFYLFTVKFFEPKPEASNNKSGAAEPVGVSLTKKGGAVKASSLSSTATATSSSTSSSSSSSLPAVVAAVSTSSLNKASPSSTEKSLGASQWLMFVHNVILCVFSFLTFVNTFPIVYQLFQTYGFGNSLTNGEYEKLYDGKYGYWSHLFYLSKFYEFVDTWIVIFRGKKPLFLQVYHHIGAVLAMWLVTITKSTCGYLFVVENSFIHTIMYAYYAMSVLGIQCRTKHFITIAQMLQFVIGVSVGWLQLWLYGPRLRPEDVFTILFNQVYVSSLFFMFFRFYNQSYRRPKEVKQE